MQITDIADAMIIRRLFTILFKLNVILVTTSNRPPDKLYEGGINRASFVPFISIVQESMVVVGMNGVIDYRKEEEEEEDINNDDSTTTTTTNSSLISTMSLLPRYICRTIEPSATIRKQLVDDWFATGGNDENGSHSETIPVAMGRSVHITKSNTNCAILTFDEVCNRPLGAADYIALSARYDVLIITNVPQLDGNVFNQARRFVTLIDAIYEAKTILIIDADVNRDELFVGFNACITTNDGDEEIALVDDHNNKNETKTIKNEEIVVMREGGSSSSSSTTFISSSSSRPNNSSGSNGSNGDDGRVEWSATGRIGVSLAQLSSVREVSFSFARADSRLAEMCTSSWGRSIRYKERSESKCSPHL